MQTMTTSSLFDDFRRRRPTYSRPALTSEIVRPAFQRGIGGKATVDTTDRYESTSRVGSKRPFSPLDSYSTQTTARSISTASPRGAQDPTTSSSMYADLDVAPHVSFSFEKRGSSTYLSTKTNSALTMVANCASEGPQNQKSVEPQPIRKRIYLSTARRREQCRANQARYRQKQIIQAMELEQNVQKLRADIPVLELQRNHLLYGGQQNVWNVVVEYFHVFRFGVPVCPSTKFSDEEESAVKINTTEYSIPQDAETKRQLAFLRSSMTEDVILGERSGVNELMNQWRLYSSCFQNLYLQLQCIRVRGDKFVSASAVMNVTVTEATLHSVFPHVRDNASVLSRLLGRRLFVPCSFCFEWDASNCRVSRLETTLNIMAPLTKALGDLSDVAFVLEHARITRDGAVGICDT